MNKLILCLLVMMAIACPSCSKDCNCPDFKEKTIVINSAEDVSDVYLSYRQYYPENANSNTGAITEISMLAWTVNGTYVLGRSLLGFSLAQIPKGSEIVSAKLSLYGLPTAFPSIAIPQGNSGDNALLLQRVIAPWNENTVTWNSQPLSTVEGQITMPVSTSTWNYNVEDFDVTSLVSDMYITGRNYGFMLKLKTEDLYRCIGFLSSEYFDPNKRPSLKVTYKYLNK